MSIVAVIPARGGSKRIPNKNIKSFCGKPIIAYSIEAAVKTGVFDRIIVSTDSQQIANIAKEYGADVPFMRPAELSDDFAGTDDVIKHALNWFLERNEKIEYSCCIYATAPFVQPDYIRDGLKQLQNKKATTAFTVSSYPYTIFRSLEIGEDDLIKMIWPENFNKRSQDLPEAYHDAGQFYWVDVKKYLSVGKLFTDNSIPVILPRWLVQDIDTPEDWIVAERLFRSMNKEV